MRAPRARSTALRLLAATALFASVLVGQGLSPPTARASGPMTWYLDDVRFHTGATASGSFRFDTTTNTYSDTDIEVRDPDGTIVRFTAPNPGSPGTSSYLSGVTDPTGDLTGRPVLGFALAPGLNAEGRTVDIVPGAGSFTGFCFTSSCAGSIDSPYRDVTGGAITSTNTAPSITSTATPTVPERQTAIIDIVAVDDNDAELAGLTFQITGGADASLIDVDPSGILTFRTPPLFAPAGDADAGGDYEVDIEVADSAGLSVNQSLTISVTDVDECQPGYYSATGGVPCTPADAGFFVPDEAATTQTPCPAGYFSAADAATGCTPAPPGTFVAAPQASQAVDCGVGEYQPLSGRTSCLLADPGHFVAVTGATQQTPCQPGEYQPQSGRTSCLPADPGHFVDTLMATTQTPCEPGRYQPLAGQEQCIEASVNHFVDTAGATGQTPCPPFEVQPLTGQTQCVRARPVAVLVAGNADLAAADVPVHDLLGSLGFDVVVIDDDTPDLAAAVLAADPSVVVLSSTVVPAVVGAALADLAVGLVTSEGYLHDEFGLTSGPGRNGDTAPRNRVSIVAPSHPVAGGSSGLVFVSTLNRPMSFLRPTSGTVVAVEATSNVPVLVAWENGKAMDVGVAPARRVAAFPGWSLPPALTPAGADLLASAILWAADIGIVAPNRPPTADAGPDLALDATGDASLDGTVTDDGLPTGTLDVAWSQQSGPDVVTFSPDDAEDTVASFPVDGTYVLVLSADDGTGPVTDTVTVVVRTGRARVAMVAGTDAPPRGDRTIRDRLLAAGVDLTIVDDDDLGTVDLTAFDAVFVTTSVRISTVGSRLKGLAVPVIVSEGYLFDDMGMGIRSGESAPTNRISILDPGDPLASGLVGNVVVQSPGSGLSYAIVRNDARVAAHEPGNPNRAVVFSFDAGDQLSDGTTAAGDRFGFFANYDGAQRLTAAGVAMLDATIATALS